MTRSRKNEDDGHDRRVRQIVGHRRTVTWPRTGTPTDNVRPAQDDAVGADPVAEAFRLWMRSGARAGWVAAIDVEVVGVVSAGGRVTAEPVRALWSVPAYRAAAMDGIAARPSCATRRRGH